MSIIKEGSLLEVKKPAFFKDFKTKKWTTLNEGEKILCVGIRSWKGPNVNENRMHLVSWRMIGLRGEMPFEWQITSSYDVNPKAFFKVLYHHFNVLSS